ncbi:MAG: hypothetical protein IJP49_04425 [Bacteroidales bacterium]|nr:hypothetical protein [Bacteroidales bacterium]
MGKLNTSYIATHDIDWFCKLKDAYLHVASAGGYLPQSVNDMKSIMDNSVQVSNLPIIGEHTRNTNLLKALKGESIKNWDEYYQTFELFAEKGFYSLDRTMIGDVSSNIYHVVCIPSKRVESLEISCASFENVSIEDIPKDSSFDLIALLEQGN